MQNLLVILRCLNANYKTVLQNSDGKIISPEIKNWKEAKDYEEHDIISRLQFELYGEYPLSESNQTDFDKNVRGAFKNI